MRLPFINIHSHHPGKTDEWTLISFYADWEKARLERSCSIGLHPWYIRPENWLDDWEKIKKLSRMPQVQAMGECGLDRMCQTDWQLQEQVFRAQLLWANEIGKPVIIHCVRAFEETLRLIRQLAIQVPCIFHGFNKKMEVADNILLDGHYLGFGAALLHGNKHTVLQKIPADRFFLETDDREKSIRDIYEAAASIRDVPLESIILQQHANYLKVFGLKPDTSS